MAQWGGVNAESEIDVTTLPWVNNGQGCTQDFNNPDAETVFGTDAGGTFSYVDVSAYGIIKLYGTANQTARLFINRGEAGDNGVFYVDIDAEGVGVFNCNTVLTTQPKAQYIHLNGVKSKAWGAKLNLSKITVSGDPIEFPEPEPFDKTKNHALLVTNGAAKSNPWDYQAQYTLPAPLEKGKTYVIEFAINAVNGGETRVVPNGDGSQYLSSKGLWTNEFTRYQAEFTAGGNHTKLEFDLGACGGEVYLDNVSLVVKGETTNLIANGDFETEGIVGWAGVSNTMVQVEKELGEINDPGILVSVGEAGWRTFRTGSNVQISDPSVKAYVAKYVAEGNYVKLTEVTDIPSWQSVLIEAPQGNYLMKSPASVSSFPYSENDLKANGGTPLSGADGNYYGLAKKNDVVGFYKIAASSEVPAWAIYLEIPTTSREFIGFGGETTGIQDVNRETIANNRYYDMQGRSVAQPQKGLYIVNGKKVLVK